MAKGSTRALPVHPQSLKAASSMQTQLLMVDTNTKSNSYITKYIYLYIQGNSKPIPFLKLTQALFNKIRIKLTLQTEKPPNTKAPFFPRCCSHVQEAICFYYSPLYKQLQKLEENKPCWKTFPYVPLETLLIFWAQHPPARPGAVSPVYLFPPSRLEIHSVSRTIHFYFSSMRADLAELLHHLHKTKILL